jgi:GTPase SAR1 family protein
MSLPQYYDQVSGALLCFSVEDRTSFRHVIELHFARTIKYSPKNVTCYLVGCKADSTQRAVSRAEAEVSMRLHYSPYIKVL